jgi:putative two-component system response regulator
LITVANALRRRELEAENRMHRERLEQTVLERTASLHQALERLQQAEQDIRLSQEETVLRLARASEQRDDDTGHHIRRMSLYCALLARRLGWSQERCEMTRLASVMHDVGKIGIPDHILGKPGALTPHEFNMMKQHVDLGYRILVGSKSELLQLAASIAWTHHEKYDGSGYVRGLAGEAIPIEGRIAAIADVFDALTSKRVYRPAFSVQKAVSIMQEGRGKHFDPALLDLFLTPLDGVLAIKHEFDDPPP